MFRCVFCKKTNSVKVGLRKNRSGFVQKYACKDCGRSFVDRKGFERMRTNPEIIVTALDLRAQGLSYGKICKHVLQRYNKKVSRKTILDWQNKFGEMIDHFTKSFQLTHSSDAHTDEIYLRQKGYEIDQFIYYWDTIDYDTKFIIADHISDEKSETDGKILMRKLKNNLKEPPNRIHTDNSYDYPRAIRWTFGYRNVIHVHHPSWKKQFKNNPIERFHNTIRENIKVMRCFYNSTTAYKFLTFLRNYYNFLRPHTTLNGQTPAQAAGFGQWNWWTLIKAIIITHHQIDDN